MKNFFFMCFVVINTILSMGCTSDSKASTKVETKFERQELEKIELRLKAQTILRHKRAEYCAAAYSSSNDLVYEMKRLESLLSCPPGFSNDEYLEYKSKKCYFENNYASDEINSKKRKTLVENQKKELLKQKDKALAELEQMLHEGYFCVGTKPDEGDQHHPKSHQESRYLDIINILNNEYSINLEEPGLQLSFIRLKNNLKKDKPTDKLDAVTFGKLEILQHLMENWKVSTTKTIAEWKYN